MAPANDSSPPSSHTPSSAHGCGAMPATIWGTKKMPPPMTFETTIAAASSTPSRGSRRVGANEVPVLCAMASPPFLGGAAPPLPLLQRHGEAAEEDRVEPRVGGDGLDVLRGHPYVVGGDQAAGADEGQEGLHVLVSVTHDDFHQAAHAGLLEVLAGLLGARGIDLEGPQPAACALEGE